MARTTRRGVCAWIGAFLSLVALAASASADPNVIPIAGGGLSTSDPANALHATLALPQQTAVLRSGDFFDRPYVIADYDNCVIREVTYPDAYWAGDVGAVTTVVGSVSNCANQGTAGTDGTTWKIDHPTSVSATGDEHVLIADSRNGKIDSWSFADGTVSTVAGSGTSCPAALPTTDPADATFCQLWRVAADPGSDRFLILDQGCAADASPCGSTAVAPKVFLVDNGVISVAATGCTTGSATCFERPLGITWVGSAAPNDFLITDAANNRVLRYTIGNSTGTTVAGTGAETTGDNGDGGLATAATFSEPSDVVMSGDDGYYIADHYNCAVRKVNNLTASAVIFSIAQGCDGASPDSTTHSSFGGVNLYPYGLALGPAGLYVTSLDTNQIELIDRTTITSGPAAFSNVKRPSFQVEILEGFGTFVCALDLSYDAFQSGTHSSCGDTTNPDGDPLPYTLPSDQSDGSHTFYACTAPAASCDPTAGPDNGGIDPTPASRSWIVDTSAPTGLVATGPADGAVGQPASPGFTWTSADSGLSPMDHYELWIDGRKDKDVPVSACTAGACTASPAASLTPTAHKWHVRAVDAAGNAAETADRSIEVNAVPSALFSIAPNPALPGRPVTFDASASRDYAGNAVKLYEWDLDGDGSFETGPGESPTATKTYTFAGSVKVALRVTDALGTTATHDETLTVSNTQNAGQLGVTVNNGAQYTNKPDVTLTIAAPATATQLLVSNDGGFLNPSPFKPAKEVAWKLDSSGPERLPKTVYVRFVQGAFTSPNYTDDIILDERPPVVDQASVAGAATAAASVSKVRTWKVKVKARDSNSGVAGVQVAIKKSKPGKLIRYKTKLKVKLASRPKFLRARDRAGNYSRWKKLR